MLKERSSTRLFPKRKATFSYFFDLVRTVSYDNGFGEIHMKIFQNNEAFVFLAIIGFVTLGSKVMFSGGSAALSSLS